MREAGQAGDVDQRSSRRRAGVGLGNALVFSVPGGLTAAAGARRAIGDHLSPRLDPETVELTQLLLSEIVNNCVLHGVAAGPETLVDVTASTFPQSVWVEVSDGGPLFKHRPVEPALDSTSGLGLYLVQQLSSSWGISADGAARVWFELPRTN
jgi:anti-sigma regulatory factor (Ser/Thr protein kinase)